MYIVIKYHQIYVATCLLNEEVRIKNYMEIHRFYRCSLIMSSLHELC